MTFRPTLRTTSAWLFGLAATILFISVWGRAVVVDTEAMAEAITPLSKSVTVVDLFTDWLGTELEDNGVDPTLAGQAVDHVLETSEVAEALEKFVSEVVDAAALPGAAESSVDVAGLLEPAVPEIAATLNSADVAIPESEVARVVRGLDPMVIRQADARPYVGPSAPIAGRLGTAAVLSVVVMGFAGGASVAASQDRLGETRRLLTRVAVGGLSFGILLKIGSWVLDPEGGRAPLTESIAAVVESKWLVPIEVGVGAGVAALVIWGVRRVVRLRGGFPLPAESPTPAPERELSRQG